MTVQYTARLVGPGDPPSAFRRFADPADATALRAPADDAARLTATRPDGCVLSAWAADERTGTGYYAPVWVAVRRVLAAACRGEKGWDDCPPLFRLWAAWDRPGLREFVLEGGALLLDAGEPDGTLRVEWNRAGALSADRAARADDFEARRRGWRDEAGVAVGAVEPSDPAAVRWDEPEEYLGRDKNPDDRNPLAARLLGDGPQQYRAALPPHPVKNWCEVAWPDLEEKQRSAIDGLYDRCFVKCPRAGYFDAELLDRAADVWLLLPVPIQAERFGANPAPDPHQIAAYARDAFTAWAGAPAVDWLERVEIGRRLHDLAGASDWFELCRPDGELVVVVRADARPAQRLLLQLLVSSRRTRGQFIVESSALDDEDRLS